MVSTMPIRKKILLSMMLLSAVLLLLVTVSLQSVYAYKDLTKRIGEKLSREVEELWSLGQDVGELRSYIRRSEVAMVATRDSSRSLETVDLLKLFRDNRVNILDQGEDFMYNLELVRIKLNTRRKRLETTAERDPLLASSAAELYFINEMLLKLKLISQLDYE